MTAAGYVAILSDSRMAEIQRALQVQKAFQQVLDNPDAAKALGRSRSLNIEFLVDREDAHQPRAAM
jgi:hypothetical protein